jgi:hypothetical protein
MLPADFNADETLSLKPLMCCIGVLLYSRKTHVSIKSCVLIKHSKDKLFRTAKKPANNRIVLKKKEKYEKSFKKIIDEVYR